MRIDHLTLTNFRRFERLELALHPRCTVLAGVNGSGKTSILDGLTVAMGAWFLGFDTVAPRNLQPDETRLQSIALGLGAMEPQYPVVVEASGQVAGVALAWRRALLRGGGRTTSAKARALRERANEAQKAVNTADAEPTTLPILAYYGAGRLWQQKKASSKKRETLNSRADGYRDCLAVESNAKLFVAWMSARQQAWATRVLELVDSGQDLASARAAADPWLAAVERAAVGCLDDAKRLRFDTASNALHIVFDDDRSMPFHLLSDGYRNLVAMAADIAWRAVRLNSHLGAQAPQLAEGVVLIDEIELHLHPGWQRTVLRGLLETFPKLQFVVTTHSPQVLSEVSDGSVVVLRPDERGQIIATPLSTYGKDANRILEDVLGVGARPTKIQAELDAIHAAITAEELNKAAQLIVTLKSQVHDEPELTRADGLIQRKRLLGR